MPKKKIDLEQFARDCHKLSLQIVHPALEKYSLATFDLWIMSGGTKDEWLATQMLVQTAADPSLCVALNWSRLHTGYLIEEKKNESNS